MSRVWQNKSTGFNVGCTQPVSITARTICLYRHTVTVLVNYNSKFHVYSPSSVKFRGDRPKYTAKTKQELHHCWRAIHSLDGKLSFHRLIDEGHMIAEASHGVVLQVRRQSRWRTQKEASVQIKQVIWQA